jgi:hypothetical protein
MKTILKEQDLEFDLDAAISKEPDAAKVRNVNVIKPDDKIVKGGDKIVKGGDKIVKGGDEIDDTDQTSKIAKIAAAKKSKYINKLISNAIIFYEVVNKQLVGFNIDEDAIWKSIKKYMLGAGGNDAQFRTAYCDIIIRILHTNSLQAYVKKYPKQYEYFISRNGSSGTTIDYLKSINNTYLRRLDNLFVGTLGDWLDFDTEALIDNQSTSVRRKKLNYNIFNGYKYDPNTKAKVPLILRYTDSQINSKVLSYYKDNMFGKPKEQFK